MILNFDDLPRKSPKKHWSQSFINLIINRNQTQTRRTVQDPENLISTEAETNLKSFTLHQNEAIEHTVMNTAHGWHSEFVHVNKTNYQSINEYSKSFVYLAYLEENGYQQSADRMAKHITKSLLRAQDQPQKGWFECQLQINGKMSLTSRVQRSMSILKQGSSYFQSTLPKIYAVNRILEYIKRSSQVKHNLSMTVDSSEAITPQTISKTMKTLFCPLCSLYDCFNHEISAQLSTQTNYVSAKNRIQYQIKFYKALKILQIFEEQQLSEDTKQQQAICSHGECYMRLLKLPIGQRRIIIDSQGKRLGSLSSLSKSIIQLGIQMYSYDPCQICKLFGDTNISCLMIGISVLNRLRSSSFLELKMEKSEESMLTNEKAYDSIPLKHRKKKGKNKHLHRRHRHNQNSKIAICMHHFIDEPTEDENCTSCICNQRGYCLPSCLCSDKCQLLKTGCNCKPSESCSTNKCSCFNNRTLCIQGVCKGCFRTNDSRLVSKCQNSLTFLSNKAKKVRIGPSQIVEAGLGAYAGESIKRTEFVIMYLGQKIQSYIEQARAIYTSDHSFYNFANSGRTIDGKFLGNKARFINHGSGKNQNLSVETVTGYGQEWIVFRAIKNIKEHEELLFNYDGRGELAIHHHEKFPFLCRN